MNRLCASGKDENFKDTVDALIEYLEKNKNNPNMIITSEFIRERSFDDECEYLCLERIIEHQRTEITIIEKKDIKLFGH